VSAGHQHRERRHAVVADLGCASFTERLIGQFRSVKVAYAWLPAALWLTLRVLMDRSGALAEVRIPVLGGE
jgi:hypothetical protein